MFDGICCPVEFFEELDGLSFVRAAFFQRCPGIDVQVDRSEALTRLADAHQRARHDIFGDLPLQTAEQVHDNQVAVVEAPGAVIPGADAMITSTPGIVLGIHVADCAAVFAVDCRNQAIGLAHSGRKGTERRIVPNMIQRMGEVYGTLPSDLVLVVSPCIRPPHYETDFAAEIVDQAHGVGVAEVVDAGTCTASNPDRYYSYRREKGQTGRMLALLAILP